MSGGPTSIWQIQLPSEEESSPLPGLVASYPRDVTALKCSNTGKYFVFSANVIPGLGLAETQAQLTADKASTVRAFTFEKLFVRHWGTWFHGERSHPFLQKVTWSNSVCTVQSSPAVDILGVGVDADVPSKPYGGSEEWSFAPDDSEFAFNRRYDENSSVAWDDNLDVFTVKTSKLSSL